MEDKLKYDLIKGREIDKRIFHKSRQIMLMDRFSQGIDREKKELETKFVQEAEKKYLNGMSGIWDK